MNKYTKPIHRLAEESLKPLLADASKRGISLQILADPELAFWFTPYPEPTHELISRLGQQLVNICPQGTLTFMLQTPKNANDTIRLEIQIDADSEASTGGEAEFSLAILETDDISMDISLLGIDCPQTDQYVLGYDISVPLIKEEQKTGLLNQHANVITTEVNHNLNVLVVDDNEVNRMVVTKFLTRWGMRVDQAQNGELAVNRVRESNYDLILMDLEMPIMDGYQASYQIRKIEEGSRQEESIPIIALTAFTMVEARERAYASGMNDFITKPLDPPQLYSKILLHVQKNNIKATA
ncbi:MAG TPA: hypothetical protein DCE41_07515 [Cytophagales bacterium]|nr:hypothetical protein [Cytophagales bacterium]HAA23036.1 hypothetical protein [Cytophagales bacterium]HAP62081.1 hypothetical protein [Cytophagales bacterium]